MTIQDYIRVEIHGFDEAGKNGARPLSNIDAVTDITGYVTTVSFGSNVSAPWETISLTLALPLKDWQQLAPGRSYKSGRGGYARSPEPGFWIVVRSPNESTSGTEWGDGWPAVAWGRAANLSMEVHAQEGQIVASVQIDCESWLSTMTKIRVPVTAGDVAVAGFHPVKKWLQKIEGLFTAWVSDFPGSLLETVWGAVAELEVPTSLIPGDAAKFADEVPVVWDRAQCARYAPLRLPQHMIVPGQAINAVGSWLARGTIWSWISQTFSADPDTVELFPSLEYPVSGGNEFGEFGAEDSGEFGRGAPVENPTTGLPLLTSLGAALGAQPVLIYRMKPFLFFPIDQVHVTKQIRNMYEGLVDDSRLRLYAPTPASEVMAIEESMETSYSQEPVDPGDDLTRTSWNRWEASEITSFRASWNDASRINATYAHSWVTQGQEIELYGSLGTPIVNEEDIRKHGLRMHDAEWPFLAYTTKGSSESKPELISRGTLYQRITAMSELLWVLRSSTDAFFWGTGDVTGKYRPWVRAGTWATGKFDYGEWDEELSEFPGWSGYVDQVTHSLRVLPSGVISRSTKMTLSRLTMTGYDVYYANLPALGVRKTTVKVFEIVDGVIIWGDLDEQGVFVEDTSIARDTPISEVERG